MYKYASHNVIHIIMIYYFDLTLNVHHFIQLINESNFLKNNTFE